MASGAACLPAGTCRTMSRGEGTARWSSITGAGVGGGTGWWAAARGSSHGRPTIASEGTRCAGRAGDVPTATAVCGSTDHNRARLSVMTGLLAGGRWGIGGRDGDVSTGPQGPAAHVDHTRKRRRSAGQEASCAAGAEGGGSWWQLAGRAGAARRGGTAFLVGTPEVHALRGCIRGTDGDSVSGVACSCGKQGVVISSQSLNLVCYVKPC